MALHVSDEERKRAEKLAKQLGIEIPGDISALMWSLPLLETIVDRLEKLEKKA